MASTIEPLQARISSSAVAFRGYNVTNQGRSAELLDHPVYGAIVEDELRKASIIVSEATCHRVDLVERTRRCEKSAIDTFAEDISTIAAMELAQVRILEEVFHIEWHQARLAFGYSLGEVAALVAAGVYELQHILQPPLTMARECAELGRHVRMGVLFSRGRELDIKLVKRLCLEVNHEGHGVIGISSYLSPNAVLLLGQYETVDRFKKRMRDYFPKQVHLRKNDHRWPPLHTPILWEKNISDRAAVILHTMPGGFVKPAIPIISLVTGKASYDESNSREILVDWIDHPQRLWDAVCETLSAGVDTIIHVGPEPNLIPATFKRISDDVSAQLRGRSLNSLGLRAMSGIARRPWLTRLISTRATLLRAPFIEHVILEDWLLAQNVS